jgi:excinuclease UvrABC helicase subunit UvrB
LDNRPLKDEEFWARVSQGVFVSATPSRRELDLIEGVNEPIDMIIQDYNDTFIVFLVAASLGMVFSWTPSC